ncbi:hypothetical protein C0J45_12619 [Silurus meridionalis]|nr:hypothetical protein C0J45_12619 [Silurus meridionalis]
MSISTVEEVQQWVKDSTITWRIDRTRPPKGQRVIFKVDYRCHHNTKPRNTMEPSGRRTKNTNCPAKMSITLHRPQGSNGRQCRLYHQVTKSLRESSPSCSILPTQDTTTTWVTADPMGQTCIMEHEIVTTEVSEEDNPTDKLKSCLSDLCDIIEKQPGVWSATQDFINGIERVQHNPIKLASAMHAFGRYSCLLMKKRAKTMRRGSQCAGLLVTAQSTPVARRRSTLGGRRRLTVGRQSKTTSGPDHEYSQPEKRQRCSASHVFSHSMAKTK